MPSKRQYFLSADVVRVIAIVGVVSIHVVYAVYSRFDFLGGISWWFSNFINAISLVSIPFFIMISSFLLLGRDEEIGATLKRSFLRILVPFIIWVKIYFLWNSAWHKQIFKEKEIATILSGGVFHLYFLLILLGLYLLMPIFRVFVKKASKKEAAYALVTTFSIGVFLTYAQYRFLQNVSLLNAFTYWVPYLGYFLAGYYLSRLRLSKIKNRLLGLTFFISLVSTIALSWFDLWSFAHGNKMWWRPGGTQYFNEFLSPNVIVMSLALFILIMQEGSFLEKVKNKVATTIIGEIARASFGIYLIHLIIIDFIDVRANFAIVYAHNNLWLYLISKIAVVFFASLVIVVLARRIPIIKLVFGEK